MRTTTNANAHPATASHPLDASTRQEAPSPDSPAIPVCGSSSSTTPGRVTEVVLARLRATSIRLSDTHSGPGDAAHSGIEEMVLGPRASEHPALTAAVNDYLALRAERYRQRQDHRTAMAAVLDHTAGRYAAADEDSTTDLRTAASRSTPDERGTGMWRRPA